MIVETLLTVLFLPTFRTLLGRSAWSCRALLWGALAVHLGIVVYAHLHIVQREPAGIIYDDSVDAQTYYNTAIALDDLPLTSIGRDDISRVSGTVWHMGYEYLVIVCMKVSEQPMLLIRLVKVYAYFLCLAALAGWWTRTAGSRAAWFGALYLSLGWWEIVYYNIRNVRDSLIVCLTIAIFLLWQRFVVPDDAGSRRPSVWSVVALIVLLLLMAQFRVYMLAFLLAGLAADLLLRRGAGQWKNVLAMAAAAVAISFALNLDAILQVGLAIVRSGMGSLSPVAIATQTVKAAMAPVPWQYSQGFLIPSQCFYLCMVAVAAWSLVRRPPRPWAQVVMVAGLLVFMAVGLESSYARKRMPVVPIMTGWMVSALATVRTTRDEPVSTADAPSTGGRG